MSWTSLTIKVLRGLGATCLGALLTVIGVVVNDDLKECAEARRLARLLLMEVRTNHASALVTAKAAERMKDQMDLRDIDWLHSGNMAQTTLFTATLQSHGKLTSPALEALYGFYANLARADGYREVTKSTPPGNDRRDWYLKTAAQAGAAAKWAEDKQLVRLLEREADRTGLACLLRDTI